MKNIIKKNNLLDGEVGKKKSAEDVERKNKSLLPVVFALTLVFIISVLISHFFLSPEARIKRVVKSCASAVKREDIKLLIRCFSKNYSDSAGNHREDIKQMASVFFKMASVVRIQVKKTAVKVEGDIGEAKVEGFMIYKLNDTTLRYKADTQAPVLLIFEHEDSGWKIAAIEGMTIDKNSMELLKDY
ncbi:MAG: hypothetical protein AB1546_05365 [bacterium]